MIDLDQLGESANFLTVILFNLMLAGSLLFTPLISNMLFSGNFASGAAKVGGFATGAMVGGASQLMKTQAARKLTNGLKGLPQKGFDSARGQLNARADRKAIERNPNLATTPEKLPSHIKEMKSQNKSLQKLDQAAIRKQPYLQHMPERLPSSMVRLEQEEKKERLLKRRENLDRAKQKRRDSL